MQTLNTLKSILGHKSPFTLPPTEVVKQKVKKHVTFGNFNEDDSIILRKVRYYEPVRNRLRKKQLFYTKKQLYNMKVEYSLEQKELNINSLVYVGKPLSYIKEQITKDNYQTTLTKFKVIIDKSDPDIINEFIHICNIGITGCITSKNPIPLEQFRMDQKKYIKHCYYI